MRNDAKTHESKLLAALAAGQSREQAAASVGVSKTTVDRRMATADFRAKLNETRAAMLDAAIGTLANAATDAAQSLAQLARSAESETVRASSARALLELLTKAVELSAIEERLSALEAVQQAGHNGRHYG